MSVKLIKCACLVLKPHPGGVAVKCANSSLERCTPMTDCPVCFTSWGGCQHTANTQPPEACVWARWHKLPADSPLRRKQVK